jgi:hypothetical protein
MKIMNTNRISQEQIDEAIVMANSSSTQKKDTIQSIITNYHELVTDCMGIEINYVDDMFVATFNPNALVNKEMNEKILNSGTEGKGTTMREAYLDLVKKTIF